MGAKTWSLETCGVQILSDQVGEERPQGEAAAASRECGVGSWWFSGASAQSPGPVAGEPLPRPALLPVDESSPGGHQGLTGADLASLKSSQNVDCTQGDFP